MWTSSALCENFLGFVESFSLTAAFDTVDYNILLSRHKHAVGFKGTVLSQFKSYLSERSFSVATGEYSSSSVPISCHVPQGSVVVRYVIFTHAAFGNDFQEI